MLKRKKKNRKNRSPFILSEFFSMKYPVSFYQVDCVPVNDLDSDIVLS